MSQPNELKPFILEAQKQSRFVPESFFRIIEGTCLQMQNEGFEFGAIFQGLISPFDFDHRFGDVVRTSVRVIPAEGKSDDAISKAVQMLAYALEDRIVYESSPSTNLFSGMQRHTENLSDITFDQYDTLEATLEMHDGLRVRFQYRRDATNAFGITGMLMETTAQNGTRMFTNSVGMQLNEYGQFEFQAQETIADAEDPSDMTSTSLHLTLNQQNVIERMRFEDNTKRVGLLDFQGFIHNFPATKSRHSDEQLDTIKRLRYSLLRASENENPAIALEIAHTPFDFVDLRLKFKDATYYLSDRSENSVMNVAYFSPNYQQGPTHYLQSNSNYPEY